MYTVALFRYSIFVSSYPTPDAAPVTMYTFPAREGRSLSVKFGGQGGMNWDRVEMGGFFAGKDMTYGVFERYNGNVERNQIGEGLKSNGFKRHLYTVRDVQPTDDVEA